MISPEEPQLADEPVEAGETPVIRMATYDGFVRQTEEALLEQETVRQAETRIRDALIVPVSTEYL